MPRLGADYRRDAESSRLSTLERNVCERNEVTLTVDRSHAMDHVVLVLFENRSLDNLLGHLYGPEDGKTFEGVIGKDLNNPIPAWAEHGAERKKSATRGAGPDGTRLRALADRRAPLLRELTAWWFARLP